MPMPVYNAKIVVSSSNFNIALNLYIAVKEDLEKRFGKDAIVLQQLNDKQARNGCYYGDFFIYVPDATQQKSTGEGSASCAP